MTDSYFFGTGMPGRTTPHTEKTGDNFSAKGLQVVS
jgi:hypothetical protein